MEVAPPGLGDAALRRALPAMLCIVSADLVGAGEWLLQTTVEYATTRTQFDRPLGFFQAVKHPLVNCMLAIDGAKSLTYNAACAVDHEPERALRYARMAKAAASDMAVSTASRAVQFHGGIGLHVGMSRAPVLQATDARPGAAWRRETPPGTAGGRSDRRQGGVRRTMGRGRRETDTGAMDLVGAWSPVRGVLQLVHLVRRSAERRGDRGLPARGRGTGQSRCRLRRRPC